MSAPSASSRDGATVAQQRSEFARLCLAAASASSVVVLSSIADSPGLTSAGQRMLLINGRDEIPKGALAAGAAVERELGHAVDVSFACACSVEQYVMQLPRAQVPRSRLPVVLPKRGELLACLLLPCGDDAEPVLSLVGSGSKEMDDILAQQVGLRSLHVPVPGGRPDRVQTCRNLAEACGASLLVRVSKEGGTGNGVCACSCECSVQLLWLLSLPMLLLR